MYTTRFATIEDLPVLVKCWTNMSIEMSTTDGTPLPTDERIAEITQLFYEKLSQGELIFRVALNENMKIIACVGGLIRSDYAWPLSAETETIGWVVSVYTEPDYRKRRLANTLVKEVCEWFQAKEISIIRLWASQAGKPTYETLGFEVMSFMSKYI